ncbi:large neutral amino acids transporter small subunit 4-like [Ptychodera flava]|uniref:large neutral amino acids transporter small subunit 4-like n=1 Tax=Ptychodera flava TaxID=63121 RepID=UPI00396A4BEF
MAPNLATAQKRRYWMVGSSVIVENLFFSAVLLGWGSLLLILKGDDFYGHLCHGLGNGTDGLNGTDSVWQNQTSNSTESQAADDENLGCSEQDSRLNLAFTVGSFLLSGMTFPIGMAMDKFGSRILRIAGCFLFGVSCFLFGYAHPHNSAWLLFPAVACNGVGGITILFTSLQISNLFANKRSTIISLCIGSYASSAILFAIMKAMYDLGVTRQQMFTGLAVGVFLVFVNCWLNVPSDPIPDPENAEFGIHWNILKFDNKVSGKHFYRRVSNVGRRMSTGEVLKNGDLYGSKMGLELKLNSSSGPTFLQSCLSPIFIWSVVVLCITQLRLLFFIGSLSQMLIKFSGGDEESVDLYASIFGLLQMLCLITCPLIGVIMDWKTKQKKPDAEVEEGTAAEEEKQALDSAEKKSLSSDNGSEKSEKSSNSSNSSNGSTKKKKRMDLKIRKLRNGFVAFTITNTACVVFGVLVLIPILPLQILTFVLHTIIRGFIHSAVCSLYALQYPATQQGGLIGLQSLISATFALLQYPIFIAIEGPLKQDPFYVNIGLLALSLVNYGLPIYLLWYSRKVAAEIKLKEAAALAAAGSDPVFIASRPSKVALLPEKSDPTAL